MTLHLIYNLEIALQSQLTPMSKYQWYVRGYFLHSLTSLQKLWFLQHLVILFLSLPQKCLLLRSQYCQPTYVEDIGSSAKHVFVMCVSS